MGILVLYAYRRWPSQTFASCKQSRGLSWNSYYAQETHNYAHNANEVLRRTFVELKFEIRLHAKDLVYPFIPGAVFICPLSIIPLLYMRDILNVSLSEFKNKEVYSISRKV